VPRPRTLAAALLLFGACVASPEPGPQALLTLDRQWAAVLAGDSTRLAVTALDPLGDTVPNPAVSWTSDNPSVADVDQAGLVRAHTIGSASITAAIETTTAVARIVVAPAVLVGAGDIAGCTYDRDEATARLLDSIPGVVFTAGDNAYPNGTLAEFTLCYDPTWGRHKNRTRPSPGNHDYRTLNGAHYYSYFGPVAGDSGVGYYSYDLAGWHIISLNSNVSMAAGSAQERWLRADLAAHPTACTIAYWHHPRFSSGQHGNSTAPQPLWQALYDANADIVISGHDHTYERFAPQTPAGVLDTARGIREFVAGMGGAGFYDFPTIRANSEVRNNTANGVIKLTLRAGAYDWEFVPTAGATFRDSGTGKCH